MSLVDLFSDLSPPPAPPQIRSRSPSGTPEPAARRVHDDENPLFFSPGETPDRAARPGPSTARVPSPPPAIVFNRQPVNIATPARDDAGAAGHVYGGGSRVGDAGYFDPLDLSAAYGEAQEAARLEGDEPVGKKRRVMAKVDVDRLMGERGFPALMKSAKRFKPRGKGHEAKDLRDILNVYQLWAHGMFPKGDFEGTIKRVETICRTRRMEIAMKGYREAFYPSPVEPPSPPGLSPLHTSPPMPASEARGDVDEELDLEKHSGPIARRIFAQPQEEEMDGPDLDELRAMEEMEREHAETANVAEKSAVAPGNSRPGEEEDEFDGLYD